MNHISTELIIFIFQDNNKCDIVYRDRSLNEKKKKIFLFLFSFITLFFYSSPETHLAAVLCQSQCADAEVTYRVVRLDFVAGG